MPSGGVLTISLADHAVADDLPTLVSPDISYLRISVSDTGTGMDSETSARAFDPFFTTKGLANHTGLGLSTLDVIAKRHEGFVDIDSREGQGTTLHVDLPSIPLAADEAPQTKKSPAETRGALTSRQSPAGARILIVDDECAVCRAAARALKRDGFVVTEVHGGADAIAVLHGPQGASIELVLLDILMPGTCGKEVLRDIRGEWPQLPVVLMSGVSEHAGELAAEVGGASTYAIEKPFEKVQLLSTVRAALAAR
jgi:two-component system cell cycle sensor histidine kinase/response regulator CckA